MIDSTDALLTVVRQSKRWVDGSTFADTLLISLEGAIRLNGEVIKVIPFNASYHDRNHYASEILTELRDVIYDFLVTEPGYTDRILITSQDDAIDLGDLVDDVKRALLINLYDSYEKDNPKDQDWIHHSYDPSKARKRALGAMLDRMLFVNDEEQLLLPGLNYGTAASFDDVDRTLQNLILRITSNSLDIDFFQTEERGILRLMVDGRPRYFLRDSSLQDNIYQVLCIDLPGILEELGYSSNDLKAVVFAKDVLRISVDNLVQSFEYNSPSINIRLAGSSELAELALRLRYSPEFLGELSRKVIGIEAQMISNTFGIVAGEDKNAISKISNENGYWDFMEFHNGQLTGQSGPDFCGDWISALYRHLGGSSLTFNLQQVADEFGHEATADFYSLDLSRVSHDFGTHILKPRYQISFKTKEMNS